MQLLKDTRGVSIIIGALLLIIIAVCGAIGVAAIVTSLQEQAARKASYKSAVEREELEIIKISLYKGATIEDFEGVYKSEGGYRVLITDPLEYGWENHNCTIGLDKQREGTAGRYSLWAYGSLNGAYINKSFEPFDYGGFLSFWIKSDKNGSVLKVVLLNNGNEVHNETINITEVNKWLEYTTSKLVKFNEVRFVFINKSVKVWLDDIKYVNPDYWGEMEVTIRNLNIDPSTLKEVALGTGRIHFVKNYSVYMNLGGEWKKEIFTRLYPFEIPAYGTVQIRINMLKDFREPVEVPADKPLPIDILLVTDLGNNFPRTFAPPVPVASVSVKTENLGVAYKDVLILDASNSYDPDGFITEYRWAIWAKVNESYKPVYNYNLTGVKVRFEPKQMGPFRIDLEVKDDTGMVARLSQISGNITIPANRNFDPPTSLNAYNTPINTTNSTKTCKIVAQVNDSWGKGVEDVVVYFEFLSKNGNITINPLRKATNESGIATTNVTMSGNGSAEIEVSVREFVARRLVDYVYLEW